AIRGPESAGGENEHQQSQNVPAIILQRVRRGFGISQSSAGTRSRSARSAAAGPAIGRVWLLRIGWNGSAAADAECGHRAGGDVPEDLHGNAVIVQRLEDAQLG